MAGTIVSCPMEARCYTGQDKLPAMKDRLEKLATLYRAHITVLKLKHDHAMEETGFDHLVISAGALHIAFLDDMPYPFKVNPHFKWWVPIVDNPHCMLVYTPGLK